MFDKPRYRLIPAFAIRSRADMEDNGEVRRRIRRHNQNFQVVEFRWCSQITQTQRFQGFNASGLVVDISNAEKVPDHRCPASRAPSLKLIDDSLEEWVKP